MSLELEGQRQLIGLQIGNYVLRELIGEGGMGEVYLAEHPRIGRKVAIKVLGEQIAGQPQVAQRFESEARVISRLDHPNIVNLFDYGALEDGCLYYVMELLQGHELEQICHARGKFSAGDAYPFVLQICRGLQAAHDKGIVHRDLKPANIFVLDDPSVRIKILDFGIAKLLEGQQGAGVTTTGMVMGTPLFISPEQALGQSQQIGPHTDIYSLGVILFKMLSGQMPFEGTTPVLLLAKHIETLPPHLREKDPTIPLLLDDLINRCLLKDPAQRPRSAAEVALRFAEAVGQPPDPAFFETAPNLTLPPELARTEMGPTGPQQLADTTLGSTAGEVVLTAVKRRRRWPIALVAVLIVALGAGTLGTWLLGRPARQVTPTPVSTDKGSKAAKATTPAPPALGEKREVRVSTSGAPALCTLEQLGGEAGTQKMSSPCRFEVRQRQRLRLTVNGAGLSPFLKEWRVTSDLKLALAVNPRTKQLVLADGVTPAKTTPDAGPPRETSASEPTQSKRRTRRVRRRTVPATKKKTTPKKPATIGEGTLEVDL
jgi:Protein kinase domain